MFLRALAFAACALLATAAQARPDIEGRAGAIDMGPLGSATYLGIGLRHHFNDTWSAYGTFDTTVSSSASFDVSFQQITAQAEAGKSFDWLRVTLQGGVAYTTGEIAGFDTDSTAPVYGFELRWKRVSLGFSQTDYDNQSITSTSLIFHF